MHPNFIAATDVAVTPDNHRKHCAWLVLQRHINAGASQYASALLEEHDLSCFIAALDEIRHHGDIGGLTNRKFEGQGFETVEIWVGQNQPRGFITITVSCASGQLNVRVYRNQLEELSRAAYAVLEQIRKG